MRTIAEILRWRARRHPDSPCLWFQGRSRTFAELDASSSAMAGGLIRQFNVRPGDRVAILDKNSDDYIELLFALDKAGLVAVPINWRLTADEVATIVGDARPALMVLGHEFAGVSESLDCPVRGFDDMPRNGEDPRLDSELACTWQLYTSGTTGIPKGAMLTNRNLFGLLSCFDFESLELGEGGRALVCKPLYHVAGCAWVLVILARGATAVMTREVVPAEILRLLPEQRVSAALLVPAVLQFLLQEPGCERTDLSALREILYGASPISQELLTRSMERFKCRFTQLYGLTETSGALTALRHGDHCEERRMSCGRPMFGVEVKVVDGLGREVPVGEIGEVVCRSPGVMQGYWGRPQETAAVIRDGWFHTGDAGSKDSDGFLYIRDRIKDMIVSGGENVYPAEVENVLASHPALLEVAVIGVPDDQWGESIKAIVVPRPGSALTEDDVLNWCRGRMAGFKRPRSVKLLDCLPRNPSGKVLKRELRVPYWAGRNRSVN